MMKVVQQAQIDRAYELLGAYGPATAYGYMQEAGGVDCFPASLLRTVTTRLLGKPQNTVPRDNGVPHYNV